MLTRCFFLLCCLLQISSSLYAIENKEIIIGVLSHRGDDSTRKNWSPTAKYLSSILDPYIFKIKPLKFNEIDAAVAAEDIDFLLVNSGIYVDLEVRYRVSKIVTLNNRLEDIPLNVFGGVIFARKDRLDIKDISSLRSKHFIAVDKNSLGGFQMAWRLMKKNNIEPFSDLASVSFAGTHDKVVRAIADGQADVGTVRTGILETMAQKGDISLADFQIISPVVYDGFPYLHSTILYPEWPFSKLKHTSNELAQRVSLALLKMSSPKHQPEEHFSAGWTIPQNYQSVHQLFKELRLAPYEKYGRFTLFDALKRYWKGISILFCFVLLMTILTMIIIRLNRQLKKSKKSLEYQHDLILNSVCDGIYGVDNKGNCIFMNRSMCLNTGWTIDDFQNGNQHELLHHSHEDGSEYKVEECPVYLTFMDKQPRYIDDDVFWKKDGSSFPVEYSSTPMIDDKDNAVGSVVVFRDISDRKLVTEEKRRHQKEIAHIARLNTMGEMASGIAHELNQPLTAIATNAFACIQLLEAGQVDKNKLMDVLDTIGLQAQHSGEIIKQLRQFARKEQPERSSIHLNDLINEVLLFVQSEAQKSNVKIVCILADNIPQVLAQPIQIEQVLINLVKNAIEALQTMRDSDRLLVIHTELAGDNAVIVTVEDNGPGISAEVEQALFDPFITSKHNGMGLGLSISRGIIEAHHGKLYLSSGEQGMGSVFRFALPVISNHSDNHSEVDKKVSQKNLVR